ncbi:hypothetical protein [Clostridium sp. M62/1]|uniref:hypothetical protein n=1 Tax=Clostridium sp. M62/1 TaxID=411486 RepID=UPI003562A318
MIIIKEKEKSAVSIISISDGGSKNLEIQQAMKNLRDTESPVLRITGPERLQKSRMSHAHILI